MDDYKALNYLDRIPYRITLQRSEKSKLNTLMEHINKHGQNKRFNNEKGNKKLKATDQAKIHQN